MAIAERILRTGSADADRPSHVRDRRRRLLMEGISHEAASSPATSGWDA
jgi:hypothetical protein